jgi:hypothetical protein
MPMSGYTKLFSSILASTIWRESLEVRIVWITLLAMAGKTGIAEGSVPGLADMARLPVSRTRKALIKLSSPDKDSRSKEHEGRRIQDVDGGWLILNHAKYRAKLSADERREYFRMKKREYRRKSPVSTNVQDVQDTGISSTQAEATTEAEAKASTDARTTKERALTTNPNPHAKLTNIINGSELRRHGSHAWCDFKRGLCVPVSLHSEFQMKGVKTDEEMRGWYMATVLDLGNQPVGDDAFDFWRSAFAQWVGTVAVRPSNRRLTKNEESMASADRVAARVTALRREKGLQ